MNLKNGSKAFSTFCAPVMHWSPWLRWYFPFGSLLFHFLEKIYIFTVESSMMHLNVHCSGSLVSCVSVFNINLENEFYLFWIGLFFLDYFLVGNLGISLERSRNSWTIIEFWNSIVWKNLNNSKVVRICSNIITTISSSSLYQASSLKSNG